MKSCEVCGASLHLMNKFRCEDGYICKACYKKASRNYTETITQKSLLEVKQCCQESEGFCEHDEFEITGKIGNYVLFDEKHEKICIANNRMTNKQVGNPDFYFVKDIKKCSIVSDPKFTTQQLQDLVNGKEGTVIHCLKVVLRFHNDTNKEIVLLNSPVRAKSYAFKKTLNFASRIYNKIEEMMKDVKA